MNSEIIDYLLKSSLICVILYGAYIIFYRNSPYHRLNRLLLLLIVILSSVSPVLNFGSGSYGSIPVITLENINESSFQKANIFINENRNSIDYLHYIKFVYYIGFLVFLMRFLKNLWFIFQLRKKCKVMQDKNCTLFIHDLNNLSAFSFFRWVFISGKYKMNTERELIIKHESIHSSQFHSVDLILAEIYCIILWFNPFVYLLRKSLKTTHEYLADNETLHYCSSISDYLQILSVNIQKKVLSGIANNFNYLTLKKRINMITNNNKSKIKRLSYFVLIPVFVFVSIAFSNNDKDKVPSICPIEKQNIKRISSGYGMRKNPITGKDQFHKAIDFAAEKGTPVLATANGIIIKQEDEKEKGYGKMIMIKHNDKYTTTYSKLSEFKLKKGSHVKRGEIIGYVGSSGKSTGAHLHYEVWENGERVNPAQFYNTKRQKN